MEWRWWSENWRGGFTTEDGGDVGGDDSESSYHTNRVAHLTGWRRCDGGSMKIDAVVARRKTVETVVVVMVVLVSRHIYREPVMIE